MDLKGLWSYAYEYVRNGGVNDKHLAYWRNLPQPSEIRDEFFYCELSWCVYNAGMKEIVVRSKWPSLKRAFREFNPDAVIILKENVLKDALKAFNHPGKAKAVITAAEMIIRDRPMSGKFASMNEEEALRYIAGFPYIGSVTKYHVARNIGYDVVKPDRHLVRLAQFFGYENPVDLVRDVAKICSERLGYIDYVFWQWLAWQGQEAYLIAEKYK